MFSFFHLMQICHSWSSFAWIYLSLMYLAYWLDQLWNQFCSDWDFLPRAGADSLCCHIWKYKVHSIMIALTSAVCPYGIHRSVFKCAWLGLSLACLQGFSPFLNSCVNHPVDFCKKTIAKSDLYQALKLGLILTRFVDQRSNTHQFMCLCKNSYQRILKAHYPQTKWFINSFI